MANNKGNIYIGEETIVRYNIMIQTTRTVHPFILSIN